nr:MAG TPA: hypothetical protein [Caudoviricetes sp.]
MPCRMFWNLLSFLLMRLKSSACESLFHRFQK